MKPYGVTRRDRGCCPGHDKYPRDTYNSRRSKKARSRDKQVSHQVARSRERNEVKALVSETENI